MSRHRRSRRHPRWDPWDRPWGAGNRHRRWREDDMDPEEVARRFGEAAEEVASKVGNALEQAFAHTAEQVDRHVGPDVGERVASAIGQVVEKVGEAIPKPDPERIQRENDRRLLRRRDANTTRSVVSTLIAVGVAVAVVTGLGLEALPIAIVVAVLFGGRITRNLLWNRRHALDFRRAEARLAGEREPRSDDDSFDDDDSLDQEDPADAIEREVQDEPEPPGLTSRDTLDLEEPGVVEMEGRQILALLTEMGEERPGIRDSVQTTVAKAQELGQRRERLEAILADPDLDSLDAQIEQLAERIARTEDAETRHVYERTAEQLRSQAESLADVRVMRARIDAYLEASLQALRTMHIDLLRLQTGDLDDPDQTLAQVSSRADNLSLEIKGVREVVEEVQGARRSAGRKPVRTM
jgi:hypothetical protein